MTVWGVYRNFYGTMGYSFIGVFSSPEKAQGWVKSVKGTICNPYEDVPGSYEIHKYEVDKPE